jgi:hypothetical protein
LITPEASQQSGPRDQGRRSFKNGENSGIQRQYEKKAPAVREKTNWQYPCHAADELFC